MSASGFTPISIYYSTTASAVPTAANLVPGELAINTNDGKLYYEDSSGVVQVLATKSTGSIGGSNTQVQFNNSGSLGGSSGLTWDGSFLTTSSIKNSALTSGRVTYAGASGLLSDSATFVFNGTSFGVGTTNPVATQQIRGSGTSGQVSASWILENSSSGTSGMDITGSAGASRWRFLYGGGPSTGTNALTEAMCIGTEGTNAGRVGIGTSSPSGKLQIDSTNVDPSATATGITLINSTSSQAINNGGSISLGGVYTGSSITQFGYILGAKANSTDGNYAGYLSFGTRPNGDVSQERMRIDSSGNVGIGTTSQNERLRLNSSTAGQARMSISYADSTISFYGSYSGIVGAGSATDTFLSSTNVLAFGSGGTTERMRIDSSGLLLQGSTSATFTMPSTGGASFKASTTAGGSPIVEIGNTDTTSSSDSSPALMVFKGSTTTGTNARFIQFSANGSGTTMGAIVGVSSGLCAFANFSDISIKKNIQPLSGSLSKIIALKPSSFDMVSDSSHVNAGFIAQDVQKVYPEYVIENMANEGEKPLMAITGGMSGGFIAELVSAIQEQQALIESLTTRLTNLENK